MSIRRAEWSGLRRLALGALLWLASGGGAWGQTTQNVWVDFDFDPDAVIVLPRSAPV